jgi:hypothetical protein
LTCADQECTLQRLQQPVRQLPMSMTVDVMYGAQCSGQTCTKNAVFIATEDSADVDLPAAAGPA